MGDLTLKIFKNLLLLLWTGAILPEATSNNSYEDEGNHACAGNMTALASQAECAEVAEMFWPGGGCYQQPWKSIIETLSNGSAYPAGCVYETAAGGGCALLFQPDGKAQECQEGTLCHVLCKKCLGVGQPCNMSHNTCCKDQVGVPMQCVSMGGSPVCISGNGLFA